MMWTVDSHLWWSVTCAFPSGNTALGSCAPRLSIWLVLGRPSLSYGLGYHFQLPSNSVLGLALDGRLFPISSPACPKASFCSGQ